MRKMNILVLTMCFAFVIACKSKTNMANETSSTEKMESNHPGPPGGKKGDRKGPPNGDRKGPPRGGSPEETRSLEEIGGYLIGDVASDFNLKSVDGKSVTLKNYPKAEGFIIAFTCNDCPFAVMYEDRMKDLHAKYASKGYPFIAINSNNPSDKPSETMEKMIQKSKEQSFPFPYIKDTDGSVAKSYGAVRTPHIFILDSNRKVQYIGAIDDNARDSENVKDKYVENAIEALKKGKIPNPTFTKAIGCPISSSKH